MNIAARVFCLVALCAPALAVQEKRISDEGRFLYANDDDWDWVSPKGSPTPSRMSIYGAMGWSALDWMDEGIENPAVLFVGTMPGGYLTEKELRDMRTNWRSFERVDHAPGLFAQRLADGPDVCVLMRDRNDAFAASFTDEDLTALTNYVKRGGRLLVLDDWKIYRPILKKFLAEEPPPKTAEKPLDGDLRKRVDDLVRKLGDDDWSARDRATKDLIALGVNILPLIDGVDIDDPEVRARLATIRTSLLSPKTAKSHMPDASNEEMNALLPAAKSVHPTSEIVPIIRNGDKSPGRALRFRIPVVEQSKDAPSNMSNGE